MAEQPRVRVRLEFEEPRCLLSRSHRNGGLARCWLLLGPHLATVADLAVHIVRSFNIAHTYPRHIMLCMEEFVLPPFESISIFRDDDIIRVKKRASSTHGQRLDKRTKRKDICDIEQVTVTNVKKKRSVQLLANGITSMHGSHVNDKEEKVPTEERDEMKGPEVIVLGSNTGRVADMSRSLTLKDMKGYEKDASTNPWESAISKVKAMGSASHVKEPCWWPIDETEESIKQEPSIKQGTT